MATKIHENIQDTKDGAGRKEIVFSQGDFPYVLFSQAGLYARPQANKEQYSYD
jgi:hypothetical protein